ncbi:MAG: hypothetical protein AAGL97_00185 [Pseudomonadota bacterium]
MTSETVEHNKSGKQTADLSLDSMAEDLFGLNIRGVQSILTIWRRPRTYFAAAKLPNWGDTFTPAIRLWLSFFALFSALKFWWFGTNAGMVGAFATGFADAGVALPDGISYQDVGAETVLWVFGWIPFVQIISMVLLAMVYNLWGERTTLALRQRYLFAVMIPSASLMPVFLTVMLFVPQQLITLYGILLALAAFSIDFQAGYRGGFASVSRRGRLWRAGLLAFILVTINTLTTIAVQIAGIIVIGQKYGLGGAG